MVAALFLKGLEGAFVTEVCLLKVLLVFEKDIAKIVVAVRVVLVEIDGVLIGQNCLIKET